MPGHDIIVIGASAGGVEALTNVARTLPRDLPAAVFVVLHIPPQGPSLLADILDRAGPLPAVQGADGASIERGRIYVAPPDHHLLIERGSIQVVRGPRENRHRPAIDPLFRSAAHAYGPRVIGVILTGSLDDGTAGLLAVKRRGGVAVIQDPDEALYAGMPRSAAENVPIDYRLRLAEIGPALARLAHEPAAEEGAYPVPDEMELETEIAVLDGTAMRGDLRPGTPSAFSCPECNGVLWEIRDGELVRFRCRVGHAFTTESMLAQQNDALEDALWVALNTLEESASLSRRVGRQAHERGHHALAARMSGRVREAERRAELIRQVLMRHDPAVATVGDDRILETPAEDVGGAR